MTLDQLIADRVIVILLGGWYIYNLAKENHWFGLGYKNNREDD